jgi:hypothetical protein
LENIRLKFGWKFIWTVTICFWLKKH